MPSDRVFIETAQVSAALAAGCPPVEPMPEHLKQRGATGDELYLELGQERARHSQCHATHRGVVRIIEKQNAGLQASGCQQGKR